MLLLPSGHATPSEGQDRDHPIVLERYKKDEFACLLKVMYPTYVHAMFIYIPFFTCERVWTFDRATSLISGKDLDLHLKKEEWVSVLKLSTIWNMTKVCPKQSIRAGPTDAHNIFTLTRGSTRFIGCRLI